ncbi:hypothetical protein BSIN_0276 [Burkholderia singularis]|uniref:Uncharacterized protein n=1 Tax=Burkholderia singularis TaxID=1503053 RepID=A0A238H474_9BURK|nr:hypothetical protein BSIN_0276 [Burkholderia singularis]
MLNGRCLAGGAARTSPGNPRAPGRIAGACAPNRPPGSMHSFSVVARHGVNANHPPPAIGRHHGRPNSPDRRCAGVKTLRSPAGRN